MKALKNTEQKKSLDATLSALKPQVLTALNNRTYLTPLHKTLATKAESLTSLKSLYDYHPSTELDFETKETIAITTTHWYNEHRLSNPSEDPIQNRKDVDYPLAVLLPVVFQLISNKHQAEEIITIETNPLPSDYTTQIPSLPITYPTWEGEHNDIMQLNTCSVDNILAIISANKANILEALNLIGISPTDTKFYHLFKLAASNKFEELRDYIAKQLGLEIQHDSTGLIQSYNFFGSEGNFIQFLRAEELCNDRYITNFKCHHCNNTFKATSMIGTIGSIITNLETSLNRKLIPTKCKSCGSSDAICERLSGHFQNIPILLTIEIGHIMPRSKQLSISGIDQQLTISHHQQTFHYKLAGFSILINTHFYSILCNSGLLYKYDGMRNPTVEPWDCNNFIGSLNTVFYLLHSSE